LVPEILGLSTITSTLGSLVEKALPHLWNFLQNPLQREHIGQGSKDPSLQVEVPAQKPKITEAIGDKVKQLIKGVIWQHNPKFPESAHWMQFFTETYQSLEDAERLVALLIHYAAFDAALGQCATNQIPRQFFTKAVLQEVIARVEKNLTHTGLQLIFPQQQLEAHYHLKGAECVYLNKRFEVYINVPDLKIGQTAHLYQISPIPMRVAPDAICSMTTQPFRLAIVDSSVDVLEKDFCGSELTCNLEKDLNHDSSVLACLYDFFPQIPRRQGKCKPSCITGPEARSPILTQSSHNSIYAVTTPGEHLEVRCADGRTSTIPHQDLGCVRVTNIPDTCSVFHNDYEAFKRHELTNSSVISESYVVHHAVPYLWIRSIKVSFEKFSQGSIFAQEYLLLTLSEIRGLFQMEDPHPNLSLEHQALLYGGTSVTGATLLGIIVRICFRCWKKGRTPKPEGSRNDQFYRKIPKRLEEIIPLRQLEISSPLPPPQVVTTSSTVKEGADQSNERITQGHSTTPSQVNEICDVELGRNIHAQGQSVG